MSGRPETVSELVAHHARVRPDAVAFVEHRSGSTLTWRAYHRRADAVAAHLAAHHEPGARIALAMPDGPDVHVALVAAERAGLVAVGIGPRASEREVQHLMARTGATRLVRSLDDVTGLPTGAGSAGTVDTVGTTGAEVRAPIGADELWFLNSTSGTTGLPKCVMHHQRRWFAFHELAVQAARLDERDVFCSLLSAPFGFGLWTAHVTPAILGVPCVLLERFSASSALEAVARHRVSVLAAVSTQFVMMLNDPAMDGADLDALRVLFTGGEMVPPDRADEWEQRTGSSVLQFYGSNETGALSRTTLDDSEAVRLHSAGRLITSMQVRLLDPDTGADITATGGPGVAACRGALTCLGYDDDDEANAQLFTPDGWMRTGDLCTIEPAGDPNGVLTVAGRASDFIIRGGKNISAAVVEREVSTFPGVLLAAAVAVPDAVFGERVAVYCAVAPGEHFTLADLRAHLADRDLGKESWPEYLVLLPDDLPRSSGGKVAKGELRERARSLPGRTAG